MSETLEEKIEQVKARIAEADKMLAEINGALDRAKDALALAHAAHIALEAQRDKQKSAVWRPETAQNVLRLTTDGEVWLMAWGGSQEDIRAYTQGNVFPIDAKEAAERERDRRILVADMRRWAEEHGFRLRFEVIGYTDKGERSFRDVPEFAKRLHLLND